MHSDRPQSPHEAQSGLPGDYRGGIEIDGAGGHVSRYLEQVCGFVGAQDVQQIAVWGSNGSTEAMRADARAQI